MAAPPPDPPSQPPGQPRHPPQPASADRRRHSGDLAPASSEHTNPSPSPSPAQGGLLAPPSALLGPRRASDPPAYLHRERGASRGLTIVTSTFTAPGDAGIEVRHTRAAGAAAVPPGRRVRIVHVPEREREGWESPGACVRAAHAARDDRDDRDDRDASPLSFSRLMLEERPPARPTPRTRSPESGPASRAWRPRSVEGSAAAGPSRTSAPDEYAVVITPPGLDTAPTTGSDEAMVTPPDPQRTMDVDAGGPGNEHASPRDGAPDQPRWTASPRRPEEDP